MTMPLDTEIASLRVLVIEDDMVVRELLEALLPIEGHAVTSAENGLDGVALLQRASEDIDVVLCDLHLPDLRADELGSRLLAARAPSTLLVAMSATPMTPQDIPAFDAFLLKPFQLGDLTAVVADVRQKMSASGSEAASGPESLEAEAADEGAPPPLDSAIFATLSATLPASQLLELYAMTVQDVTQRVERMGAAIAVGDYEQYRREAHAIKGGCGMVGAVELRELASQAEGGAPESTPAQEDFLQACARLRRMLNVRLA
jgi:CheY-like chemotaxis protein